MARIPFPQSSYPGKNRQESGGRIVNGVVEALADGAPNTFIVRRQPGTVAFGNSTYTGYRGAILAGSALYAAFEGELVKFDSAGTKTDMSNLSGSEPVSFARNNKLPTFDCVLVAENAAFTVDASTGAASLVDSDLPSPTDVCFGDGYFFWAIADGRIFASGINAITVGALDFTRCDTKSDPLSRVVWYGGRLLAWGPDSCEIFYNAANATGFPFNREEVVRGPGLKGKWAITGHENGWEKGLFWIGSDNAVHTLEGYAARRVSTPDIDRDIERVAEADKDTIRGFCFVEGGHFYIGFSCALWTWIFDLTTQKWSEGRSYLQTPRRLLGSSVNAFGKWLMGDRLTGNLIEASDQAHEDVGEEPLVVEVTSGRCAAGFGQRMEARFLFVDGVGSIAGRDPIERDPTIEISWSDDGGVQFSEPIFRKLGRIGKRKNEIYLSANVLGACTGRDGRVFKVRMSDPRDFGLLAGELTVL